jgi:hypothetical protein
VTPVTPENQDTQQWLRGIAIQNQTDVEISVLRTRLHRDFNRDCLLIGAEYSKFKDLQQQYTHSTALYRESATGDTAILAQAKFITTKWNEDMEQYMKSINWDVFKQFYKTEMQVKDHIARVQNAIMTRGVEPQIDSQLLMQGASPEPTMTTMPGYESAAPTQVPQQMRQGHHWPTHVLPRLVQPLESETHAGMYVFMY